MPINVAGSFNFNTINAPGVYIQEQLPAPQVIGPSTDRIGFVGTASYGPKNVPVYGANLNDYTSLFGNPINTDTYDMGSQVMAAASTSANDFVFVRVTDGTDVAASAAVLDTSPATGVTITSKYTGVKGNQLRVTIGNGTNSTVGVPTYMVTIYFPVGQGVNVPEVFDNIGGAANALWVNIANAINLGQSGLRGPSQLVVATAGAATGTPAVTTYTLTGGTNGNGGVSETTLIGSDTTPRTGMYALRGTGLAMLILCNATTASNYGAQVIFSAYEACYAILARPISETIANCVTAKKGVGLYTPFAKLMLGDWIFIQDSFNNVQRYITPQGIIAGTLANLGPQESSLNKQISSSIMLGTQSSNNNVTYSAQDIIQMLQNGIDVIAAPSPGGAYFAAQTGKNTLGSVNLNANDDSFQRLTNFIAVGLETTFGAYIGQLQTPSQRLAAKTAIQSFLKNLENQQMIGSVNGGPAFSVVLDATNNPDSQVSIGIEQADVRVCFFKVIVVFLVNLQTGLTSISSVVNA